MLADELKSFSLNTFDEFNLAKFSVTVLQLVKSEIVCVCTVSALLSSISLKVSTTSSSSSSLITVVVFVIYVISCVCITSALLFSPVLNSVS